MLFLQTLCCESLTRRYGQKTAVDALDLTFTEGVWGLLGANGAGKTTLMRMLCGILQPTVGRVRYGGAGIEALGEEYRALLGYLPQDFGYYPDFTAKEFLLYIASLKGLSKAQAMQRSEALLREVGLYEVRGKRLRTYSGGMKQRLGIAQAMLNDPQILILDEPTAGLDPKERVRFRNLLAEYAQGRLVLLSTHIVPDVESIADNILLMKAGRIVEQGTVPQLVKSAAGRVWLTAVPPAEADRLEAVYTVANRRRVPDSDEVELRLITADPPAGAVPAAPTLEDVYLYHFADTAGEERAV